MDRFFFSWVYRHASRDSLASPTQLARKKPTKLSRKGLKFHARWCQIKLSCCVYCINMIPWNNESVWLDALPQNKTVSWWPVFHGSVILPYILKAIWCINMILWANKSVWLDAWPQNKSWSLWPIFHGSVAYILKTILCIRWWHWPGVYVSPCSLALVCHVPCFIKWCLNTSLQHYLDTCRITQTVCEPDYTVYVDQKLLAMPVYYFKQSSRYWG